MNIKNHKVIGDERGKLVAIEAGVQIPFCIKRVFFIYGTLAGLPRGKHAHRKTKQYLIAVSGSCSVTLDNGRSKKKFELYQPNIGLFQDAMVWGTMHNFSVDCVLLVLADQHYDEADYICNYDEFKQAINE